MNKTFEETESGAYWNDTHRIIFNKDCRSMVDLPDEFVQCVVTSPPYWGLRKYAGLPDLIWGEKKDCQHQWISERTARPNSSGGKPSPSNPYASMLSEKGKDNYKEFTDYNDRATYTNFCSLCGAWKGAYGLEPTPEMYVQHTIEIFREVKRVLRPDGVCFVNCGDSYYASGGAHKPEHANPGLSKSAQRGGVLRGKQSGKRGKGLSDLTPYDSASESLCDECVKIRLLRNSGKSDGLVPISEPSVVESSRSHKVSMLDHQDSLRSASRADHNEDETSGLGFSPDSVAELALGVQVSTNPESSEQLLGECLPKDDWFSSLDVLASLSLVFRGCGYRKACPFFAQTFAGVSLESLGALDSSLGNALTADSLASHRTGKAYDFSVPYPYYTIPSHLKAKDLCLIPQHLAIAFQQDGWWVRSVIIWNKPNPMPESVTDRPTESHEYILMLTKSARYYWDAEAVREKADYDGRHDTLMKPSGKYSDRNHMNDGMNPNSVHTRGAERWPNQIDGAPGRNLRSVWTFPTQPYKEAHFATYPEKLVEICVKAATPEVGCCSKCGKPWVRIMKLNRPKGAGKPDDILEGRAFEYRKLAIELGRSPNKGSGFDRSLSTIMKEALSTTRETLGWQPQCKCNADKVPSIVLDPFAGSGTTLKVAAELNRKAIGYELSEEYCRLIVDRNKQGILAYSQKA